MDPTTLEEATVREVELLRVLAEKITAFLEVRRHFCENDSGYSDSYGTVFTNIRKVMHVHKVRKVLRKKQLTAVEVDDDDNVEVRRVVKPSKELDAFDDDEHVPKDMNEQAQNNPDNRVAKNKNASKSSNPRKESPNIVNTNIRSQPSASLNSEAPVTNGPSDIVPVVLNQSFKGKYELGQRGRKLVKINGLAFYKHSNNVYKCCNYYNMVPRCRAKANVTELNGLTFLFTLLENHTCSQ
ncbi:unnamed protein product [Bursaphelenchus okinawaensis]|uniref:Uncharacterized protein n=1 Tax=Bursaphelenchus okinawaensis TaxID=465554 RepID=A0A811KQY3_9BILA|nr:unnamed protein product [Bursaphelenchus okinawaensis]CAG9107459.1 unnamed protein product [Bursaphelenchus okinawaensis]